MNQYKFLENHYQIDYLQEQYLTEIDLLNIPSAIKNQFSKINLPSISNVYKQFDNKITNKLKEYDIDANEIKSSAKSMAKEIANDIKKAHDKKVPIKTISKVIDKKIKKSMSDILQDSVLSFSKMILSLIISLVMTLFIMTLLLAIFVLVFGLNIYLSYAFILLFVFEIWATTLTFMINIFDEVDDKPKNIFKLNSKVLNGLTINSFDDNNLNVYTTKTLIQSFKNIFKKLK